LISEYIHEGQRYGNIKKAYSINLLYFRLGQGQDYIYEYQGSFIGRKKKDLLNPTNYQKKKYAIQTVADIFPQYYILRVGSFKAEKPVEPIDEWFYFLKNSEIKDSFKAKGMERAKTVLDVERMSIADRRAYQRHIENRRMEHSVLETAEEKGARRKTIEFATESLKEGFPIAAVAKITKLSLEEVTLLSQGKDLDADSDN
jgi:hypothetical protein